MSEQTQTDVKVDVWDDLLSEEKGPAAIVIRERLRPAAGRGTPVAPPTFAGRGQGKSDYHCDGEGPEKWAEILRAIEEKRVVNRCTLDSIPSQANRMESGLKRFEGTSIPRVTLTGVKRESMTLLEVGHRVADAALWSADNYGDFQKALEAACVQGDSLGLAKLAPTSLVFGYWDSREAGGKRGAGGKTRRLVRSEIWAENVVKLTRKSQYWASVDPEASEELKKALDEAKAKAKDDDEKDAGSQLGFRDAPASGLGGVIAHGEIVRLTILSLTGLRNLSAREGGQEDADATKKLRRYLFALMLAAATSTTKAGWDLREGCLLVQERKPKDGEKDGVPDITWTHVYHDGREEPRTPPVPKAVDAYVRATADEFFKPEFPAERLLKFNPGNAAQQVRDKLAKKDKARGTGATTDEGGDKPKVATGPRRKKGG